MRISKCVRKTYPNDDSSRSISRADLEVSALGDMVEEELQEVFVFFDLEADDTLGEALVDV